MSENAFKFYPLQDDIGFVEFNSCNPAWGVYKQEGDNYITNPEKEIVDAARVSTKGEEGSARSVIDDFKLLRYLISHRHDSPMERVVFKLTARVPIFVARQWMRYRAGSFNEESARYREIRDEWFTQVVFRKQDVKNKQASYEEVEDEALTEKMQWHYQNCYSLYQEILLKGYAREIARGVLPQSMYTSFIWTVNLRNLLHFVDERTSLSAQKEIRVYAESIKEVLQRELPNLMAIYAER